MEIIKITSGIPALVLSLFVSPSAFAGGFMLQEQSQLEIGRAFSGAAASADDPSTIFYNPAGMTELEGVQISTGATLLFIDSKQQDLGSDITSVTSGPFLTLTNVQPITGNNGGNPFKPVVPVPTTYISAHIGKSRLWLGLGISSPFGLKLDYAPDFFGRYDSLNSELLTIDVQPSIGYKLSDAVSIGGGLNVQYAEATLTNALPSSNLLTPADRLSELSGDDISLGWNAGVLVKLKSGTRFGLHYRSGITHQLKGENKVSTTVSTPPGLVSSGSSSLPIRAPLRLPDSITASLSLPLDAKTRFMATGRYYNWSRFKDISVYLTEPVTLVPGPVPIVLSPSSQPLAVKEFNYRDSWSLSAGIERALNDKLTVRAGAMFDRTPTNPNLLSTRVPDGDRTWTSMGLSYRISDRLTLSASYAHVFIAKQNMDRTDIVSGPSPLITVTTRSRSSGNVDMIATSVTARF